MPKKNNPGCGCCGGTCGIFADDFNRADSTNIGSDFTEVAGNSQIVSNKLRLPASAVVTCNTAHSDHMLVAEARVTIGTSNDIARLIVDYQDTSNYYFAEYKANATTGYIAVFRRSAGTNTLLTFVTLAVAAGTTRKMRACFSGTLFVADLINDTTGAIIGSTMSAVASGSSGTTGMGTAANAGNVDFDDFAVYDLNDGTNGCNECAGPACNSGATAGCTGEVPYLLEVEIAGLVNGSCGTCEDYNGVYIVERTPAAPCLQASPFCCWKYILNATGGVACEATNLEFSLNISGSPGVVCDYFGWIYDSGFGGSTLSAQWRLNAQPKPVCNSINVVLPINSVTQCGGSSTMSAQAILGA